MQKLNRGELDLKAKLSQVSVLDRIKYNFLGDISQDRPYVVELDPTTACNLGCPDCISSSVLGSGGFSTQKLLEIASDLVSMDVKAVVLIGGGEPMMHPGIDQFIDYMSSNGVKLGLTTNGLFLDQYSTILREQFSWVRVSVDAGTSKLYKNVRPDKQGNSRFDNLIDQMTRYASLPRAGLLGYSFLLLSSLDVHGNPYSNASEIYQAACLAKQIGCDYFEIKPSFDPNHFHIIHSKETRETAIEQISKSIELETKEFQVFGATDLIEAVTTNPKEQPKSYSSCNMLRLRTLINPLGVFPCPYFRGDLTVSYGDPQAQSFSEIWRSDQRRDVFNTLTPSRDCRFHCIRHNSNLHVEDVITSNHSSVPVPDYNPFI